MKNKKVQIFFLVLILTISFMPLVSSAQNVQQASQPGFFLVQQCTGTAQNGSGVTECGWTDLIALFQRVIAYLIFIGTTFCAISLAYAGFLYASSMGNTGQVEKAHRIFNYTIIGLLFIWGGWLLVATVLKTLGVQEPYSLVNFDSVATK